MHRGINRQKARSWARLWNIFQAESITSNSYCNAESHFQLGKYKEAIPLYEKLLNVCFNNEKGDALYRLGFCYMFNEDWANARDYFNSATAFYERFSEITPILTARLQQIKNMVKGCEKELEVSKSNAK